MEGQEETRVSDEVDEWRKQRCRDEQDDEGDARETRVSSQLLIRWSLLT